PSRVVFIANKRLLGNWYEAAAAVGPANAMIAALANETVLAYELDNRADRARFRRSLQNTIENAAVGIPRHSVWRYTCRGINVDSVPALPALWRVLVVYIVLTAVLLLLNYYAFQSEWRRLLELMATG